MELKHIAFIVDGNRRWARERNFPDAYGHETGIGKVLPEIISASFKEGISEVSVWVFSTENWKRSKEEVNSLMKIFVSFSKTIMQLAVQDEIQVNHFGRKDRVPDDLLKCLNELEQETKRFKKYKLNVCLDYGGHDEIVNAIKQIILAKVPIDKITIDLVSQYMFTKNSYPLDLIIRTGGEQRLSGLFNWSNSYSELYFEEGYFPSMTVLKLKKILNKYKVRQRRFGK